MIVDFRRVAGRERRGERRRALGLDADHLDAMVEPGGDPRDQPAAADGDEHGVERGQAESGEILLPFEPDRALAGDRFRRVIGVDFERAGWRRHRRRTSACASK